MKHLRIFLKFPGIVILTVASALAGGISQPAIAGCFLLVLGIYTLVGGVIGFPHRGVLFWWGAWVRGLLGLVCPLGGGGPDSIPVYQPWV